MRFASLRMRRRTEEKPIEDRRPKIDFKCRRIEFFPQADAAIVTSFFQVPNEGLIAKVYIKLTNSLNSTWGDAGGKMRFIRPFRSVPAGVHKRCAASLLAAVFFYSNVLTAYAAEKNFWTERRGAARHTS